MTGIRGCTTAGIRVAMMTVTLSCIRLVYDEVFRLKRRE